MAESSKIRAKEETHIIASTHASEGECNLAILEKAIEIAGKRRQILADMRTAIRRENKELVFDLAKKLTGLSDETSHRADQSIN